MYLNDYAETLKSMGYKEIIKPNWYVYVKNDNGTYKVAVILFNSFNTNIQRQQNIEKIKEIIDADPCLLPLGIKREYLFLILTSRKGFFRRTDKSFNVIQIAEDGGFKNKAPSGIFKDEIKALKASRQFERSVDKSQSYDMAYGYRSAFISYLVMFICIALYVKGADATKFGASYEVVRKMGHYQNLLTAGFIHNGLLHLFGNMLGLIVIGLSLEKRIGHVKYLALIFMSVIFTNLISVSWFFIEGNPQKMTVGLSGAVFAVLAADVVYGLAHGESIAYSAVIIAFNLLTGTMNPVINNTAHISGLVFGLWFMLVFVLTEKVQRNKLGAYIYKEKVKRLTT